MTTQSLVHINQHFNETGHCTNGLLIEILGLFWFKKMNVKFSCVFNRYKDTHKTLIFFFFMNY